MSLIVLREKSDIYDMILKGQKAFLRENPVRISVRAPRLADQKRKDLESEIQRVVGEKFEQTHLAQLREARRKDVKRPSIGDHQMRRIIKAQIRQGVLGEARRKKYGKGAAKVTMSGLALPKENARRIESEVQQIIKQKIMNASNPQSPQELIVCGCGWPFGGCCDRPGTLIDLTQIDPLPVPPGRDLRETPLLIGLCLDEDVLTMGIWDPDPRDPTEERMTNDQILVGLRNESAWAKEIQGWTTCLCQVDYVHQDRYTGQYVWMFISKEQVDTLVFAKAKFLGVMTAMYSFESVEFWKLLGGHILTFDWLCAWCRCG